MVSVSAYYHRGQRAALDKWNGGEGQRTGTCRGKVGVGGQAFSRLSADEAKSHLLAKNLLAAAEVWTWGVRGALRFEPGGLLRLEPDGGGGGGAAAAEWGTVPSPWRKDTVYVRLGGETYLLMFLSEKWSFVAVRCADEQVSYGRLQREETPQKRLVF